MAEPSAEGAAAAAGYFMSLYPYVFATGDITEWNTMSGSACDFCANTRTEVQNLHSSGARSLGGLTVLAATAEDLGSNNWFSARLKVRIDASSDVDANGAVLGTNDGGTYDVDLAMSWADRWIIDSAGIIETLTAQ
ncbi:hypothetical protein J1G42_03120 [Cellulomonas sp. zg-ZUI222]|nr:hypothetical protein [Cellulomonas wangleii]